MAKKPRRNLITILSDTSLATGLVAGITLGGFILSYTVLVGLAIQAGIPTYEAWIWPLCLDFFMLTASLVVLRRETLGESALYPWSIVGGTTLLSIGFNVYHAPNILIYQIMYALPPAVTFLAFELLMGLVKSDLRRENGAITTTPRRAPAKGSPDWVKTPCTD